MSIPGEETACERLGDKTEELKEAQGGWRWEFGKKQVGAGGVGKSQPHMS